MPRPSFGIVTAPQQVAYDDVLRVWREADTVPEIEHAWLFDHLLPIGGDPDGPILEGWTLLSALAAQTSRLRLGLLVTSNRIRPPALLAKIATTVDIVSGGRLEFGIGAGSAPASRGRVASTTPTACPTTTSRTRWAPSTRRAR
jgi:alkanesulfonate monooxygenase SsuD/methylene tetrahydromethanopterin reductase-like flavin-dependent oxidoreductase (luciferase family)